MLLAKYRTISHVIIIEIKNKTIMMQICMKQLKYNSSEPVGLITVKFSSCENPLIARKERGLAYFISARQVYSKNWLFRALIILTVRLIWTHFLDTNTLH